MAKRILVIIHHPYVIGVTITSVLQYRISVHRLGLFITLDATLQWHQIPSKCIKLFLLLQSFRQMPFAA